MGELADRVDSMRVSVSTPDGGLTAELRDRDQLSLTFRDGLYQLLDDADLGRRLAVLAQLLWVARTREYWRIYGDVTGDYSTGEDKPISERDIAWKTERDNLEVTGSSADGRVTVRCVGMRQWQVTVRPGTVRALDEHQFSIAAGEAAGALIRDQFAALAALSNKYYGEDR
ncbi:hypothetical protein [Nucisporomicrobium flavum]|uniref:hypothetical protein n=1 Tax=Nucisporomicrobium flavum TaxID=2785915 RepID=UPI0018F694E0|nr:hypothetical protein [Nucisporomicrobium flavum]